MPIRGPNIPVRLRQNDNVLTCSEHRLRQRFRKFSVCLTTMSSTYAHYQGPSSLPSDYAILSALNQDSHDASPHPERGLARRESLNAMHRDQYLRPPRPTIGTYPRDQMNAPALGLPSETTPLLSNPPVPRIEEPIDRDEAADDEAPVKMFWEELFILTRYALPVFG